MLTVLTICLPFFALIFLGTWLRYSNFITESFSKDLSKFAFYIAMPPYIMFTIAKTDISHFFDIKFLLSYEVITVIIFCLSALLSKYFIKIDKKQIGFFGLNSSYPNYGYIGIPLSILAFGDKAAIPLSLILFADTFILLILTVFFVAKTRSNYSLIQSLIKIPLMLIKNPLLIAVILGALISIYKIQLFPILTTTLTYLANSAIPAALISLGAMLFIKIESKHIFKELIMISIFKLILHPLFVFIIFFIFPIENKVWMQTAILISCLPVAANVFVLADHYGDYQIRSSQAITLSTVLSIFTVPIVLYLLLKVNF